MQKVIDRPFNAEELGIKGTLPRIVAGPQIHLVRKKFELKALKSRSGFKRLSK